MVGKTKIDVNDHLFREAVDVLQKAFPVISLIIEVILFSFI